MLVYRNSRYLRCDWQQDNVILFVRMIRLTKLRERPLIFDYLKLRQPPLPPSLPRQATAIYIHSEAAIDKLVKFVDFLRKTRSLKIALCPIQNAW